MRYLMEFKKYKFRNNNNKFRVKNRAKYILKISKNVTSLSNNVDHTVIDLLLELPIVINIFN